MIDDEATGPERPLRVLMVEPDEEACRGLARLLQENGIDVVTAARGLEALQEIGTRQVDLMLSASELPDLRGADLLNLVMDRYPYVRVALMAQWRSRSQFEELMKSGVFAFLRKPVRVHEILRMLEQLRSAMDFRE